ncbi:MAG: DsbC family protein [Pseudomonadota bacterium]
MLIRNLCPISLLIIAACSSGATETSTQTDPRAAVEARFAETQVDEVSCDGFGPLCQVVAGKAVFYVDPDARHAFIGRVYDLEGKRDLTEETLATLRPEAWPNLTSQTQVGVTWGDLPFEASILRNEGGKYQVAVFSDINCGYCRRLSDALHDAPDIEVREFLVGMSQSADVSNAIACADDPEAALQSYYATRQVPVSACDRDVVTPAIAAARAINMSGTPTFMRPDGATMAGFQSTQQLRAWLEAGLTHEEVPQ